MKFGADVQRPPLTSADEHDDQISEDSLDEDTHHGRGRPATVYDAVAGESIFLYPANITMALTYLQDD